MDPNANVTERISLLRAQKAWTKQDAERYAELVSAYVDWRRSGGFSADGELLEKLADALAEVESHA